MHAVEDHPIADGQALVLADIGDSSGGVQLVPHTAVVQHRETIVVALYKSTDDGGDPADQRDDGKDEDADGINGLPQRVSQGEPDAATHVLHQLAIEGEIVFLSVDERFGLFAQVGEQRRADDEEDIFEQREIEEDKREMEHHPPHYEQETEDRTLLMAQETLYADDSAQPGDRLTRRGPEEIDAYREKDGIKNAGYQDPLP